MPNAPIEHDASWYQMRCGCLTASLAPKAFSTAISTLGDPLPAAVFQVATERMTGICTPNFVTEAMQYGIDHEADAVEMYMNRTGEFVDAWGPEQEFITHPTIDWLGCTPDGLVGDDGLIEVKCPSAVKHFERLTYKANPDKVGTAILDYKTLIQKSESGEKVLKKDLDASLKAIETSKKELPYSDYREQLLVQLIVTGRKWVDFIDYRHDYPSDTQILVCRFEPSREELNIMEARCVKFLKAVEDAIAKAEA